MMIDFEFRKAVMDIHIGSEGIKYCYQCSKCTDSCPVAAVANPFYENIFDPRMVVLGTLLGYKDLVMSLVSKNSIIPGVVRFAIHAILFVHKELRLLK